MNCWNASYQASGMSLNSKPPPYNNYKQPLNLPSQPHHPQSRLPPPPLAVTSCGALPTPQNGRKNTFAFTPGTMVKFECDPGYILVGEARRWCYASGDWSWPEDGEVNCMSEWGERQGEGGYVLFLAWCSRLVELCVWRMVY